MYLKGHCNNFTVTRSTTNKKLTLHGVKELSVKEAGGSDATELQYWNGRVQCFWIMI